MNGFLQISNHPTLRPISGTWVFSFCNNLFHDDQGGERQCKWTCHMFYGLRGQWALWHETPWGFLVIPFTLHKPGLRKTMRCSEGMCSSYPHGRVNASPTHLDPYLVPNEILEVFWITQVGYPRSAVDVEVQVFSLSDLHDHRCNRQWETLLP